ncbi:MAG: hypothetical protein M1812_001516 [Candelaria pacifica]|nr:MAG: hypothetical protein M1812_001516 [Candelaria pacifica]
MTTPKIAIHSLSDLKNTTDDALPNYLNSLSFKQSQFLTDVRLVLGYTTVAIAAATFYFDYTLGFEKTKGWTLIAVIAYFLLNGVLTYWIWGVEKGKIFVGELNGTQLTIQSHVDRHIPVYHLNVSYALSNNRGIWHNIHLARPFTKWFSADGFFVAKPLQQWLATEIPVVGQADPGNVVENTDKSGHDVVKSGGSGQLEDVVKRLKTGSSNHQAEAADMTSPTEDLPLSCEPNITEGLNRGETFVGDSFGSSGDAKLEEKSSQNDAAYLDPIAPARTREQDYRLQDELTLLHAEQVVSNAQTVPKGANSSPSRSLRRSRSRHAEVIDEFEFGSNPTYQKASSHHSAEDPSTRFAIVVKRIHNSSFLVRYFTYIVPVVALLLIPVLLCELVFPKASVGGVSLTWFSLWLEIIWLSLWASRIAAKFLPGPLGKITSLFGRNSKNWRDMAKQLELHATIFFWLLAIEVSFLPTMKNHHTNGKKSTKPWEMSLKKVLVSLLVGGGLNFLEKIVIQLIAISFHQRAYADRIENNKFQIRCLVKMYKFSRENIDMEDSDFEEDQPADLGTRPSTPMQYLEKGQRKFREAFSRMGDVGAKVAADFTGHEVSTSSTRPKEVVLMLLHTMNGSQVLARRLYRTFARENQMIVPDDFRKVFADEEEGESAFTMLDKDLNGDISMVELEAFCVDVGRERKSITASLKDMDSVVSRLNNVLTFIVLLVTLLVLVTVLSTSAAGVLTSAGSAVLALSWLFSATAQEFLQSVIFLFIKHPFDVGDRVTVYGNQSTLGKGEDYLVKGIALLYTEFKKLDGQIVQAPNSYLNTLFILNMRRSGAVAEAVPMTFAFGTTISQIEQLGRRLTDFVVSEKREYGKRVITGLREVEQVQSIVVNVIFFYKSNLQNELLRLQRRNKFICVMMVIIQELDIEGPQARLRGAKEGRPFFYQAIEPLVASSQQKKYVGSSRQAEPRHQLSRDPPPSEPNIAEYPDPERQTSISRQETRTSRTPKAPTESVSDMSKRLDFSLGTKGLEAGDIISAFDDREPWDVRKPSRSPAKVRASNDSNSFFARTMSHEASSHLGRRSNESQPKFRHTQSLHRNRFFGKQKGAAQEGAESADMMEQGMADIPETDLGMARMNPRR